MKVKVVGKGVSTKSLVKATDLQIKIDKYSNSVIPYGKIFVVFDKDSFSDDDFDDTIKGIFLYGLIKRLSIGFYYTFIMLIQKWIEKIMRKN